MQEAMEVIREKQKGGILTCTGYVRFIWSQQWGEYRTSSKSGYEIAFKLSETLSPNTLYVVILLEMGGSLNAE